MFMFCLIVLIIRIIYENISNMFPMSAEDFEKSLQDLYKIK